MKVFDSISGNSIFTSNCR